MGKKLTYNGVTGKLDVISVADEVEGFVPLDTGVDATGWGKIVPARVNVRVSTAEDSDQYNLLPGSKIIEFTLENDTFDYSSDKNWILANSIIILEGADGAFSDFNKIYSIVRRDGSINGTVPTGKRVIATDYYNGAVLGDVTGDLRIHIFTTRFNTNENVSVSNRYGIGYSAPSTSSFSTTGGIGTLTYLLEQSAVPLLVGDQVLIPSSWDATQILQPDYETLHKTAGIRTILTSVGSTITFAVEETSTYTQRAPASFTGGNYFVKYDVSYVTGPITFERNPQDYNDFGPNSVITQNILDDKVNPHIEGSNPHGITAFDVNLDEVNNTSQIPMAGTLITNGAPFLFAIDAITHLVGNSYRIAFSGNVDPQIPINDTFEILSAANPIFDADDWVVTTAITVVGNYSSITYFDATSVTVGDTGGVDSGTMTASFFYAYASGADNTANTKTPYGEVTGNVQFEAQPSTLPGFDRLSVITKGYHDDNPSGGATNTTTINVPQDFIDAATTYVGDLITLPTGVYALGDNIDLGGDRLAFDVNAIVGFTSGSVKNNKLSSTGLVGDLLTITDAEVALRAITICNPTGNFVNATNSAKDKELIIDGCIIEEFLSLGTISGFKDVHIEETHFSSFNAGFVVNGSIRHYHLNQNFIKHSKLSGVVPSTFLYFNNVVSEKLDVSNSNFESVHAGDIAIDVTSGATFSVSALIQRNDFGNTYTVIPLQGADAGTPGWYIAANTNIGLSGLLNLTPFKLVTGLGSSTSSVLATLTNALNLRQANVYQNNATSFKSNKCRWYVAHDQTAQTLASCLWNNTDSYVVGYGMTGKYNVADISYLGNGITRYTFDNKDGEVVTEPYSFANINKGETATFDSCTNASNNGTHLIVAVNDAGTKHLDVLNTNRVDAVDDEVASPGQSYGGSVLYTTTVTGGVFEAIDIPSVMIYELKDYRASIRRVTISGGNPSVSLDDQDDGYITPINY